LFNGWPAFYKFFFERYHWTLEQVNACPIYLACILLGAISPDHTNVRMTFKDTMRYYADDVQAMELLSRVRAGSRGQG
jgi:hypothetical protein